MNKYKAIKKRIEKRIKELRELIAENQRELDKSKEEIESITGTITQLKMVLDEEEN